MSREEEGGGESGGWGDFLYSQDPGRQMNTSEETTQSDENTKQQQKT